MSDEEIEKHKKNIEKMSHAEMASLWRFAPSGHPYFNGELPLFDYFNKRFKELGSMTKDVSKAIGW